LEKISVKHRDFFERITFLSPKIPTFLDGVIFVPFYLKIGTFVSKIIGKTETFDFENTLFSKKQKLRV